MKSNIYIIIERSPAKEYGIGTYLSQVRACFAKEHGPEPIVIELSADVPEVHWNEDLRTLYIPTQKLHLQNKEGYLSGVMRILRFYINSKKCIFIFNFFHHSALISSIKEHYKDSKIIFVVHYLDWTFHIQGNTKRFKEIIRHPLAELESQIDKIACECYMTEKATLDKVDHVVCLCNYTARLLINSYCIDKKKISVIYNGAEDYTTTVPESKKELKQKLHISPKEKIILYVGRLHDDKGCKELVQAFRIILKYNPFCRLIVVGSGNIESFHKESNGIWHKITFTGRLDKEELFKLYKIADVGVLPSFTEQCSYVVIEMMMFSIPVVGTDSTGLSEMIEDGITGYKVKLTETDDRVILSSEDLANHVMEILNTKQARLLKQNSRYTYLNKYTLAEMQNKLRALIFNLLDNE